MSKKCIKCGHPLPDNASFCPHCTAVQMEKKEVKTPRRWKKKMLTLNNVSKNFGKFTAELPDQNSYSFVSSFD